MRPRHFPSRRLERDWSTLQWGSKIGQQGAKVRAAFGAKGYLDAMLKKLLGVGTEY